MEWQTGCEKCPLVEQCLKWPEDDEIGEVPPYASKENRNEIMVVGEAPGEEECKLHEGFVGRTGQKLRQALMEFAQVNMKQCYVTNAIRCRPVDANGANREPTEREIYACSVHLQRAIDKAKPRLILAVGGTACFALLGITGISRVRGGLYTYRDTGIYVYPIYHPSHILRAESAEDPVIREWLGDITNIPRILEEPVLEDPPIIIVRSMDQLEHYVRLVQEQGMTAIDVEDTESGSVVLMVGFTVEEDGIFKSVVVPVEHPESPFVNNGQLDRVRQGLRQLIINPAIKKVGHNYNGHDRWVLKKFIGCDTHGLDWDTMYGSYIHDERRGIHDLGTTAARFISRGNYDWKLTEYRKKLLGGKHEKEAYYQEFMSHLDRVPLDLLSEYNGLDAAMTEQIMHVQKEALNEKQHRLVKLLTYVSEPYSEMEQTGILFDMGFSIELSAKISERMDWLKQEMRQMVGDPDLNLDSQPQMGKAIYENLKVQKGLGYRPDTLKTKTGRWSTSKEAISKLAATGHPILNLLTEYRDLQKDLGTYVIGLQKIVGNDGRIHEGVRLHGTDTGRGACRLHNIKKKSELMNQFIAPPGSVFVKVDLSQIEMRVMAEMSEDPELVGIYQRGEDFHEETRAWLFGPKPEDPSMADYQRRLAKNCNFGTAFGLDELALYDYLMNKVSGFSMSRVEVAEFHQRYYGRFSRLAQWQTEIIEFATRHGYVENLFGRQRRLDMNQGKHARNQAINTPIQASAHDLFLVVVAKLHDQRPLPFKWILEVHDALIVECEQDKSMVVSQMLKEAATVTSADTERFFGRSFGIPISGDIVIGKKLGELE